MRIVVTSVLVDDQAKALTVYTDVLGFVKEDVPLGESRWLTVVAPDDADGTELLLEPDRHPAARPLKDALVADVGLPGPQAQRGRIMCAPFAACNITRSLAR
jgi:catechol 2,3-dioxygenase-like lactoylglutathione lyase family enzyme